MPKSTDSVIFSESEREILEVALQNPGLSNAEIAERTGMRLTLVRDTREQYEDDVELAEGIAETDAGSTDGESVTVDDADRTETQQAILETAANNPAMMNAEIANETGARIALVRDTLDQYGDAIDRSTATVDDSEDETESATDTVSEPNDTQTAILDLAAANPDMTNAEIAEQTGTRITLVRDTLEEYEATSGTVDGVDAANGSKAGDDEFSERQLEILEIALENPDLTNGEIAEQTGARIALVRDTIADYQSDDEESTETAPDRETDSNEIPSEIDTAAFSETQIEILRTKLANPGLTNGEIAEQTGTRLTLVRDTIFEHEHDDKPWDKELEDETDEESEADETETDTDTASSTEKIEMPETTASDLLSDTERAILETALKNPELTNGEIADRTGARLTLVRDTRATYEDAVDLADADAADDTEVTQPTSTAEPTERQREILDTIQANPDLTNSEIAEQTGTRITLVRDTRQKYETRADVDEHDREDTSENESTDGADGTDAAEPAAESDGSNAGLVVGILLALLLAIAVAAGLGII